MGRSKTPTRVVAYERATCRLYDQFSSDVEARVFYALAVVSAGYAAPTDMTLSNQKQPGEMLERPLEGESASSGVAHYIIHSYDITPSCS